MRTILKVRVEKIIEVDGQDGEVARISAGTYEQTVSDGGEQSLSKDMMRMFRKIVAIVNGLKTS